MLINIIKIFQSYFFLLIDSKISLVIRTKIYESLEEIIEKIN